MRKQLIFSAAAVIAILLLVYTASRSISARIFTPSTNTRATDTIGGVDQQQAALQTGKPIPYLPPKGLLGPGQVTELNKENQHLVREQLRGHKKPVFELVYSSTDPRSKQMEAWVEQAAKANPMVTFIKLDTTKLAVATPVPTVSLSIPRPSKDFSRTGYLTDAELQTFLDNGLKSWTPIQHQQPLPKPTPNPDGKPQNKQHIGLPHFHKDLAPTPGSRPREYQD